MSRSNPTENQPNPAKIFAEWNGDEGGFRYYDKQLEQRVPIPLPFTFLVLDILATAKGYNEPEKKGYWSNEVRNVATDIITVRSKSGVEMTGLWKDIKEKMGHKGLDYVQSVYILYREGKEAKLGNLQLKGAAIGPWIEFCKENKVMEVAVHVKSFTREKKGKVNYVAPVYEAIKVTDKTNQEAIEMDKELQEYLTAYFARNTVSIPAQSQTEPETTFKTAEPVEDNKTQYAATHRVDAKNNSRSGAKFGEEQINSSPFDEDVPF